MPSWVRSFLLPPASCLLPPASCLPSCLLPPASCLPPPPQGFLTPPLPIPPGQWGKVFLQLINTPVWLSRPMDRHSLDSDAIAPGPSSSPQEVARPSGPLAVFGHLWQQYPLVFWSGIWTLMLVMAAIAMSGLLNPDLSQPVSLKVSDHPIANDNPQVGAVASSQETHVSPVAGAVPSGGAVAIAESQGSPLWMLLLLTATCGLGCVALSAQLRGSRTTPRERLQRLEALAQSLPEAASDAPPQPTQTQALQRFLPAETTPPAVSPATAPDTPFLALPAASRPPFQIPQQSRLRDLDRRAPGLAELLDIQRRREGKTQEGEKGE